MSGYSKIEWTNATWNPLTGCTLVSEGCRNCYAAREAAGRLSHLPQYQGLAVRRGGRPVFTGEVRLHPDRLDQPLRWRKPRRVFVNSMSDLFHEAVPFHFIDQVFAIMALSPRHTFQVLTKRPERMRGYFLNVAEHEPVQMRVAGWMHAFDEKMLDSDRLGPDAWPLPNVWLGTSVENQATADKRIPHLLMTPAAVRFLSCEPLLGPVDLTRILEPEYHPEEPQPVLGRAEFDALRGLMMRGRVAYRVERLHWVIVGGESGPNARPMHPNWARQLRDQCQAAGVAYFFKQWGEHSPYAPDDYSEEAGGAQVVYPDGNTGWVAGDPDIGLTNWTNDLHDGWAFAVRVGKKEAGRELDGRIWNETPA